MILSPVVHTSCNALIMIQDVVRCHEDTLSTMHSLKLKVEAMKARNDSLTEKVTLLERIAEEKRRRTSTHHLDVLQYCDCTKHGTHC